LGFPDAAQRETVRRPLSPALLRLTHLPAESSAKPALMEDRCKAQLWEGTGSASCEAAAATQEHRHE
jgi:hypothetical protein